MDESAKMLSHTRKQLRQSLRATRTQQKATHENIIVLRSRLTQAEKERDEALALVRAKQSWIDGMKVDYDALNDEANTWRQRAEEVEEVVAAAIAATAHYDDVERVWESELLDDEATEEAESYFYAGLNDLRAALADYRETT